MFVVDTQVFDLKDIYRTDEGYLSIPATIARSGIQEYCTDEPFMIKQLNNFPPEYRKPGLIIRVLRPQDEVFKPESMSTFASKPVTNSHPSEMVNANNAKNVAIGFSDSKVEQIDDMIKAKLTIWDKAAIEEIEKGKNQLSAGYKSDMVWESGNDPVYGPYDAKFTNIIANHIALVQYGRAGSTVKLMDKANDNQGDKVTMAKRTIGNVEIEISDDKIGVIDALMKEKSELEKAVTDHLATIADKEKVIADSKKEIDKVKGEKDALEAKIADTETLDSMVEERVIMLDHGKKYIKDFDGKGKSNQEIKKEILTAKMKDVDLTDKSTDYIDAAFDVFVKAMPVDEKGKVADALNRNAEANDDDWRNLGEKARDKFIADSKEAYKGKVKA